MCETKPSSQTLSSSSNNNNNHDHSKANGNGNGVVHSNGNGLATSNGHHSSCRNNNDVVINLDKGDPKMYYPYWKRHDEECSVTIKASDLMSYFADVNQGGVFYQLPEFTEAVRRIHDVVGNAVTDGRYIIGGTGSSQLFTIALRALASNVKTTPNYNNEKKPVPVVCAEPFYSCYAEVLEEQKSEKYQWLGDANTFHEKGPYIEVVTTPNNPDGAWRNPVVNKEGGMVICDLAYYWPQYTPIVDALDYDVMLFTLSKATGHAGSRVGWAIVKDKAIATTMIKLMTLETIGTCHEGQLRAVKILEFVADTSRREILPKMPKIRLEAVFEFGHRILAQRWDRLRDAVHRSGAFTLPKLPPNFCNYMCKDLEPNPAYAWMELISGGDAAMVMSQLKIRTRSGARFGVSSKFIRVNMMESEENFNLFLERLATLKLE